MRNTYDLFHNTKTNNLPGMAVMVNFEKALDSMSIDFVNVTLELFGFGSVYRNWINILLGQGNCYSVTLVNGHISEQFLILWVYRQGDLIACYLFVLCIEVLVLLIKKLNSKPTGQKRVFNFKWLLYW